MEGYLIQRFLCPLFSLREPDISMLKVRQGTLAAQQFLITYFNELIHFTSPPNVKPTYPRFIYGTLTENSFFEAKDVSPFWSNVAPLLGAVVAVDKLNSTLNLIDPPRAV
jgi:hypothetical protein